MQSAKALIYPVAQLEIHSHKAVEAMMCGCPVITYNIGALNEVVGLGGLVVNTEDEFIKAMQEVQYFPRDEVRKWALKWDRTNIVGDYVKLMEEVAGGKRW